MTKDVQRLEQLLLSFFCLGLEDHDRHGQQSKQWLGQDVRQRVTDLPHDERSCLIRDEPRQDVGDWVDEPRHQQDPTHRPNQALDPRGLVAKGASELNKEHVKDVEEEQC